jgi:predicted small secreted protein
MDQDHWHAAQVLAQSAGRGDFRNLTQFLIKPRPKSIPQSPTWPPYLCLICKVPVVMPFLSSCALLLAACPTMLGIWQALQAEQE